MECFKIYKSPMWKRGEPASKENLRLISLKILTHNQDVVYGQKNTVMRTEQMYSRLLCKVYNHLHKDSRRVQGYNVY